MIGKIHNSISLAVNAENRPQASKTAQTATTKHVELSREVQSLQSAKADLQHTSDVDMDKVTKMKQLLQSGQASVDLDKLAGTMVDYYQGNQ
ncbi:flagellar biosynthesis anti-sigma factor FlgM [Photobacterium kagoshimensis]|uniref:flagellar biosynthesis anti-sigma factor FlgM n=1 Tax=Photobacterium kagoshimensis TaxID=2910242 RepID=UPI003D112FD0